MHNKKYKNKIKIIFLKIKKILLQIMLKSKFFIKSVNSKFLINNEFDSKESSFIFTFT